jgi:hypothetical protein
MKLIALVLLIATPAAAQNNCGGYADIAAALAERWGEHIVFQGPTENGQSVVEIFAKPDGTWTALIVNGHGLACIVASGQTWTGFGVPQGQPG